MYPQTHRQAKETLVWVCWNHFWNSNFSPFFTSQSFLLRGKLWGRKEIASLAGGAWDANTFLFQIENYVKRNVSCSHQRKIENVLAFSYYFSCTVGTGNQAGDRRLSLVHISFLILGLFLLLNVFSLNRKTTTPKEKT